jgi:hypothetical protein
VETLKLMQILHVKVEDVGLRVVCSCLNDLFQLLSVALNEPL